MVMVRSLNLKWTRGLYLLPRSTVKMFQFVDLTQSFYSVIKTSCKQSSFTVQKICQETLSLHQRLTLTPTTQSKWENAKNVGIAKSLTRWDELIKSGEDVAKLPDVQQQLKTLKLLSFVMKNLWHFRWVRPDEAWFAGVSEGCCMEWITCFD